MTRRFTGTPFGFQRLRTLCLLGLLTGSVASCADRVTNLSAPIGVNPHLVVGAGVIAPGTHM